MRRWLLLLLCTAAGGCLRSTSFHCASDPDCGSAGTCETTGYCSFAYSMCAGGRRYGELSGGYANKCVGDVGTDGGVDSPTGDAGGDAGTDGGGNCPAGFAALSGVATHEYKLIGTSFDWQTQHDACAGMGANVYLAVPDDATELGAIITASASASVWVGIDDIATEGTYVTSNGGTFDPMSALWDTANGEPDNPGPQGGQDCVAGNQASGLLSTEKCSQGRVAVCECEP